MLKADLAERLKAQPNVRSRTGLRDRVAMEIMHRTAVRVSEMCNLRPEHVDYTAGVIEVHGGKGKGHRGVGFGPIVEQWLRRWSAVRPQSEWLMCTLKGTRLSPRHLQRAIRRYARQAGIPCPESVTPHTLRNSWARDRLAEGYSLRWIQEQLGHKSVSTTKIYLRVRATDLAEMMRESERKEAAAGLVGAPVASSAKNGADEGIHGRLYFHDEAEGGRTKQVIFSVKAGDVTVAHVRDLRGVVEREKAEIGVLLSMQKPTKPMRAEAAGAGFYNSPWGTKHPRLQILTVADLLSGKGIDMPQTRDLRTFKKAPKARVKGTTIVTRPDLLEKPPEAET